MKETLGKTSFAEERKPLKMNLQLFASDGADPGAGETTADVGSETSPGFESTEIVETTEDVSSESESTEDVTQDTDDESTQSPEVNAAFARMRKQLEKANSLVESIYGKDFGIKSVEELEALYHQMEQEYHQKHMEETGQIDPEYINSLINNHPAIKAATQVAEDQRLLSNFNELKKEYPELVKTADDIPPEVWDKFDQGISLVDAYTIVNRKNILQHYRGVGKQQTLNNISSKKHLKTEGDGSNPGDSVSIPQETLQMYIDMGMTKEQATSHYKKLYK